MRVADVDELARRGHAGSRLAAAALFAVRIFADTIVIGRSEPRHPSLRSERWRRFHVPLVANIVVAVLLLVVGLAYQLEESPNAGGGVLALFFVPVLCAAFLNRDRWPLASWRLAVVAALVTLVDAGITPLSAGVFLLCCYTVATRNRWHVSLGVWLVAVLSLVVMQLPRAPELGTLALVGLGTAVALLIGANVRGQRRAQQERVAGAERNAQEQAARALVEERARIARELHDVVAHHMSVIAIQAEAAPLRDADDAAALVTELGEIRGVALEALAETRHILAVLREDGAPEESAPQPGLDRVGELIANVRAAGHRVTQRISGTPRPASAGVELSAYRIVQESLSNVMRHAPKADVDVELSYEPTLLRVRVVNEPGRAGGQVEEPSHDEQPHGLAGMKERTVMLSGTIAAGPTADGGFEVVATLPLEAP